MLEMVPLVPLGGIRSQNNDARAQIPGLEGGDDALFRCRTVAVFRRDVICCGHGVCAVILGALAILCVATAARARAGVFDVVLWQILPNTTATRNSNSSDPWGAKYVAILEKSSTSLRLDVLVVFFFGVSAVVHALVACATCRRWTAPRNGAWQFPARVWASLNKGCAPWRWIDYVCTSTCMVVGLALVTGTREQSTVLLLGSTMATIIANGFCTEAMTPRCATDKLDTPLRAMLPHLAALPSFVVMWIVLLGNFFGQLHALRTGDPHTHARVPGFVAAAVIGSCVLFALFAVPQWIAVFGTPSSYWRTEVAYCVLGATAKVYLGLLLYVNVLRVA